MYERGRDEKTKKVRYLHDNSSIANLIELVIFIYGDTVLITSEL